MKKSTESEFRTSLVSFFFFILLNHYYCSQGALIPITFIDNTVEWLENQCFWTLKSNGTCIDVNTAIAIDTTSHSQSLSYKQVYQLIMQFYALPNYHSSVHFSKENSVDLRKVRIPVWMTRVMLLAGWTQQFFDKESVDLANVILALILKKVPVAARSGSIYLLVS
ncbi:hypothetical protein B9Z55_009123 [Caenorhabditis nigoni]|uniref:Uncharacterized protein n=1 Tax=Caenorhabditis nigoni TaxID=1611254 RepID=A0A2G5UQK3_9PELO|nr:hypothetical protein B9Z55_009123 [Caenorhabditis nigoni]